MLLMLSPSVSTALLDTRQTFLWTLLYQSSHSSQIDPWVLFVLYYLVASVSTALPEAMHVLCVVCSKLSWDWSLSTWNSPSPSSPFEVLEPLKLIPWLTASVTPLLLTKLSYLPLCDIAVKALPYDPLLGLLHQIVWGLIGTSYRGDPLDMLVSPTLST